MSLIKNLGTIDRSLTKKGITEAAQNDAQQVIASPQFDLLKVYVELKRYENYFFLFALRDCFACLFFFLLLAF
jgi:hypothetical protein